MTEIKRKGTSDYFNSNNSIQRNGGNKGEKPSRISETVYKTENFVTIILKKPIRNNDRIQRHRGVSNTEQ